MTWTITSESIAGAPPIVFKCEGDVITAELGDAHLRAEVRADGGADLRINDGVEILADLVVNPRWGRSLSENVIDVGSSLLWSYWRWFEASRAASPSDKA